MGTTLTYRQARNIGFGVVGTAALLTVLAENPYMFEGVPTEIHSIQVQQSGYFDNLQLFEMQSIEESDQKLIPMKVKGEYTVIVEKPVKMKLEAIEDQFGFI